MSTEVISQAKEHLEKWRKDFFEDTDTREKYLVKDLDEFYRELLSFPEIENDYILRLAEVNLEKEFASFDEEGTMDGIVYRFANNYLIVYFDEKYVKWLIETKLEECFEFFIRLRQLPN